jgi:hypothetical protein
MQAADKKGRLFEAGNLALPTAGTVENNATVGSDHEIRRPAES